MHGMRGVTRIGPTQTWEVCSNCSIDTSYFLFYSIDVGLRQLSRLVNLKYISADGVLGEVGSWILIPNKRTTISMQYLFIII